MGKRTKPWNLVVDKGAQMLLSLEVNSVARFATWAEVVDVKEEEFVIKTSSTLPSYYDAKFFFIPSAGVMYFGKGGIYVSPEGVATVYPETDFIYAEDAFSDATLMKPFAIPLRCGATEMSILYLDPENIGVATIRALIPTPRYVKKGFCEVKVYLPMEYTIKEIEGTLDVSFSTEVVFGRNYGVGVLGHLRIDSPELSLMSSAFVPFTTK